MDIEKIIEIKEIIEHGKGTHLAGFEVRTTRQNIKLLIANEASCCERWGYFMSEDNTSEFIGAQLLAVTVTDTALKSYSVEDLENLEEGAVMFVDLKTSIGVLQFVAYNAHNGDYGHEAKVECAQLQYSEIL